MLASLGPCTVSVVPASEAMAPSGAVRGEPRSLALKVEPPRATSCSVLPAGMTSSTVKLSSGNGPPLVTVTVQRSGSPGRALAGAVLATAIVGASTLAVDVEAGAGPQPP